MIKGVARMRESHGFRDRVRSLSVTLAAGTHHFLVGFAAVFHLSLVMKSIHNPTIQFHTNQPAPATHSTTIDPDPPRWGAHTIQWTLLIKTPKRETVRPFERSASSRCDDCRLPTECVSLQRSKQEEALDSFYAKGGGEPPWMHV